MKVLKSLIILNHKYKLTFLDEIHFQPQTSADSEIANYLKTHRFSKSNVNQSPPVMANLNFLLNNPEDSVKINFKQPNDWQSFNQNNNNNDVNSNIKILLQNENNDRIHKNALFDSNNAIYGFEMPYTNYKPLRSKKFIEGNYFAGPDGEGRNFGSHKRGNLLRLAHQSARGFGK